MASTFIIMSILCLIIECKSTQLTENTAITVNVEEPKIRYLLYTRDNPKVPRVVNQKNPHQLAKAKKIIVIIPGWLSGPKLFFFPQLKDEYLIRYDCSVIMIEYPTFESYEDLQEIVPIVARRAGKLLCDINSKFKISLKRVHVVAHSMGAQLAGLLGQTTIAKCNRKIGRITGLEPAAVGFQDMPTNQRLDKSDAIFVDVIHTAQPNYSYLGNIGHADFHVNCGFYQPGCPEIDILNLIDNLATMLTCPHERAIQLMLESINTNNYIAQSCSNCPDRLCKGDSNPEYIFMGEDCPRNSTKKVFWLPTYPKPPFGAGCTLYPFGCV